MKDIVRVIRIIEYVGARERVEKTVSNSIQGTARFGDDLKITGITLGQFPESLEEAAPGTPLVPDEYEQPVGLEGWPAEIDQRVASADSEQAFVELKEDLARQRSWLAPVIYNQLQKNISWKYREWRKPQRPRLVESSVHDELDGWLAKVGRRIVLADDERAFLELQEELASEKAGLLSEVYEQRSRYLECRRQEWIRTRL